MTNFEKQTNRYRNFERDELLEIIVKLEKRNKRQQQFIFKHFKFN